MIFRPELAAKVMAGTKTQTRRVYYARMPTNYKVGKTYAVEPGRTSKSIGRILITDISITSLGGISEEDARAEGFAGAEEFRAYWDDLYYGRYYHDQVYRIVFELVSDRAAVQREIAADIRALDA